VRFSPPVDDTSVGGGLPGHPRQCRRCYWDELALPTWTDVVDRRAGGAPLPLALPPLPPLPLPLWLPLPNE
jgi:hypothetical protein